MKQYLGFGELTAQPSGAYSWQHLTFVTALVLIMAALAVWIGLVYRKHPEKNKNVPLIWAAVLINLVEIFKITLSCIHAENPMDAILRNLPLFLCSIQLITIPLAAFSKGRVQEAALDFVCIFGLLGAVLGTYGAGQNYAAYPVLSLDNVASGLTHSISGFAALYILISGMASMKKKNIPITFAILICFCIAAYIANICLGCNYMFLMAGDGTPYDIVYNLVGGHKVVYPVLVVALFLIYIVVYRWGYALATKKKTEDK